MKIVKKNWKLMMFLLLMGTIGYACGDDDGTKKKEEKGKPASTGGSNSGSSDDKKDGDKKDTTPVRTAKKIYVWKNLTAQANGGDFDGGEGRAGIDKVCTDLDDKSKGKPDEITAAKYVTKTLVLSGTDHDNFAKLAAAAVAGGAHAKSTTEDAVYGITASNGNEMKMADSYTKFITEKWAKTLKEAGVGEDGHKYWIGADTAGGANAGTKESTKFHCKEWADKTGGGGDDTVKGSIIKGNVKETDHDKDGGTTPTVSPLQLKAGEDGADAQECDETDTFVLCISFSKS